MNLSADCGAGREILNDRQILILPVQYSLNHFIGGTGHSDATGKRLKRGREMETCGSGQIEAAKLEWQNGVASGSGKWEWQVGVAKSNMSFSPAGEKVAVGRMRGRTRRFFHGNFRLAGSFNCSLFAG